MVAGSTLFTNFLLMIMNVVEGQDWLDQSFEFFSLHSLNSQLQSLPLKALKKPDGDSIGLRRGPEILHFWQVPRECQCCWSIDHILKAQHYIKQSLHPQGSVRVGHIHR